MKGASIFIGPDFFLHWIRRVTCSTHEQNAVASLTSLSLYRVITSVIMSKKSWQQNSNLNPDPNPSRNLTLTTNPKHSSRANTCSTCTGSPVEQNHKTKQNNNNNQYYQRKKIKAQSTKQKSEPTTFAQETTRVTSDVGRRLRYERDGCAELFLVFATSGSDMATVLTVQPPVQTD